MKKGIKMFLLAMITLCLFMTNIKAIEEGESFDENDKISIPSTLNIDGDNEIGIDITNYNAYYQIIDNVLNDETFKTVYEEYAAAPESYKEEMKTAVYEMIQENNWENLVSNTISISSSELTDAAKSLLILKVTNTDDNSVIYDYQLFDVESDNEATDDTTSEEVDNSDTGIKETAIYIAPAAILVGALLVTKKKKYN